jgi:hypothetical protein
MSCVVLSASAASAAPATQPLQAIRVSDDHHYFVKVDGTPFFWLADTAWSIFNHPTPQDVTFILTIARPRVSR